MPVLITEPTIINKGGRKLVRIHVNGPSIRQYAKDGIDRPIYTIKFGGATYHCRGFQTQGVVGVQDLPRRMPGCRAAAWLETREEVVLLPEAVQTQDTQESSCPQ